MLKSSRSRILASLLSGILLSLSTPPIPLGFLAWFALVPLILAIEHSEDGKEAFRLGMWTGLIFHLSAIYWIAFNTGAGWGARLGSAAGAIIVLTIWYGLIARLHLLSLKKFGTPGHFVLILLWPAQEVFWLHGELAFPWVSLALTQSKYLPIIQLASVGGTPLVSAWVASLNAIIAAGRTHRRTGIIFLLMIAITWIGGTIREKAVYLSGVEKPIGEVALVQGNVDPALKWKLGAEHSFDLYWSMTRQVVKDHNPILVVWPETAAPVYLKRSRKWRNQMQAFVDTINVPVATGASHYEIEGEKKLRYNSSFLIKPGANKRMDWYAKTHLVPFGERVPFQKIAPSLGKLNFGQAEFTPGEGITTWNVQNGDQSVKVSSMICYEVIFSYLGRQAARKDADFIINHTNDGWLAATSEPWQHLLLSRFRSLETGRALVRATNTGISAIVLPSGRFSMILPEGVRGALSDNIPQPVSTPYMRGGWVLGYLIGFSTIILYLLLVLEAVYKRRKNTGKV